MPLFRLLQPQLPSKAMVDLQGKRLHVLVEVVDE